MTFNSYIIKKSHFKNFSRVTTNRLATKQFGKCSSSALGRCCWYMCRAEALFVFFDVWRVCSLILPERKRSKIVSEAVD
jgi:hypothetical protein